MDFVNLPCASDSMSVFLSVFLSVFGSEGQSFGEEREAIEAGRNPNNQGGWTVSNSGADFGGNRVDWQDIINIRAESRSPLPVSMQTR